MKNSWEKLCSLGLPPNASSSEKKSHQLSNAFFWIIALVALIYNPVYAIMGYWSMWYFSCSLIVFLSSSMIAVAMGRVQLGRILHFSAACYGVLGLTIFLGPDSNFEYMAVMAAIVIPIILPATKSEVSYVNLFAFLLACLTLVAAPVLAKHLNPNPVLGQSIISIIVSSCVLMTASAVFFVMSKLINALTSTNTELDSLMHALPDTVAKVNARGDILHMSGLSLGVEGLVVGGNIAEQLGVAQQTGQTLSFRVTAEAAGQNKTAFPVSCRLRGISQDVFLLLMHDSTEDEARERVESEQRAMMFQSAKLATLGEMAGGIAHEINNPLAVISTSASILRRSFTNRGPTDAKEAQICEKIEKTVVRISRIVQGLKTFARDGTADNQSEEKLSDILRDTLDLCEQRFRTAGVPVTITGDVEGIILRCSAVQISQVLLNLLNNAFQATAELSERWVKIEVVQQGEQCLVRVEDSGPGIPPSVVEKMFQPFFTTKPIGQGTGLGLSISRSIIATHGGDLFLDQTRPNTCFVVSLPTKRELLLAG
jgi:signal transduction histidine kinase